MNESCSNFKAEETELNRTIPEGFEGPVGKVGAGLDSELEGEGEAGFMVGANKTNEGKRTVLDNSKGSVIYFSIHMHMGHINGCLFSRRNPNQSLFLPNNIGDKTLPQIIA